MVAMTTVDTAREAARHASGRFGAQQHTAPELDLSAETEEDAHERGVADARQGRAANPGAHIDEYMGGYEAELLDLEDFDS
jgi:hypothetical protein